MATPRGVSIAIPTYNRARLLRGTLESLRGLRIPSQVAAEIVVIDNNCTDETASVVETAIPGSPIPLRHVIETRQGLCFGRNRALDEARHEHVVYLDDDIDVAPDWLDGYFEAIDAFGADCVVGPVTPRFENPIPHYVSERVLASVSSPYSRKGDKAFVLPADVAHEVPGCNFGVRKAIALAVGGFDNTLDRIGKALLAGGDFEFGQRLVRAGRLVAYEPRCAITHWISAEKLSKSNLRRRWYGIGASVRGLEARAGRRLSIKGRARRFVEMARLFVACLRSSVAGPCSLAFQKELEFRRALGYLRSPVA